MCENGLIKTDYGCSILRDIPDTKGKEFNTEDITLFLMIIS
jgi:hypothetical protein